MDAGYADDTHEYVWAVKTVHEPREDQGNDLHPRIHMGVDGPGRIQAAGDGWGSPILGVESYKGNHQEVQSNDGGILT